MKWRRSKADREEAAAPAGAAPEGAAGSSDAAAGTDELADAQAVADRAAAAAVEAEGERQRTAALAREARRRREGPFDAEEVSEEEAARPRVDLGALRLPAVQGMELRLEMEEGTQRVIGAVVVLAGSTLQLQAFAAPRTEGIWDEVRAEIRSQVARQGGAAEDGEGPFGPELLARLPMRTEDGRTGARAVRFTGVDGPRWFVRAVVGGRAAVDPAAWAPLERLLRGVVVVRGADAMAPRDLLPLRLPPQDQARPAGARPEGDAADATPAVDAPAAPAPAAPAAAAPAAPADAAGPDAPVRPAGDAAVPPPGSPGGEDPLGPLDPFRRGPEITERR